MMEIPLMKKNSAENFGAIKVDTVTGEYYINIPEWIINEQGWYEDTEINMVLDGSEILLSERTD